MNTSIRLANTQDAFAIAQAHVASWRATYNGIVGNDWLDAQSVESQSEKWSGHLSEPDEGRSKQTFVICRDEQVRGFAVCGASRDTNYPDYGELWAIYLHPDEIGRGMGKQLFNAAAEHVSSQGFTKMFVRVLAENASAQNFYERMGGVVMPDSEGMVELGAHMYRDIRYEWKDLQHD